MDRKKELFLSLLRSSDKSLRRKALGELSLAGTRDLQILSAVVDILANAMGVGYKRGELELLAWRVLFVSRSPDMIELLDRIPCDVPGNVEYLASILSEVCCPKATRKLADLYSGGSHYFEVIGGLTKHLVCYLRKENPSKEEEEAAEIAWNAIRDFMRNSRYNVWAIVRELCAAGEKAVDLLVGEIEYVSEEVQCEIIRYLAGVGSKKVLNVLVDVSSREDFSPRVRAEAVESLGKCIQKAIGGW